MNELLHGLSAVITGASRGIGLAIAELYAEHGANLVLVARDSEGLERVRADICDRTGRTPEMVSGDLAEGATAERAVSAALAAYGRIDVLANVAGWYPAARVEDTSDDDFRATIDSNLYATFAMCRAAVPAMRENGGSIVNMSSTAARFPTPGLAVYGASKAGVEAFTRSLAVEVAPKIRVNAVSAGPTLTDAVADMMEHDSTGAVAAVTNNLPLGRMAHPHEIAEVFLFLASQRASVITGQVLHANCGGHMA